ncbi:MAG: putative quinol monooxygenase [Novosphingobium sp.]
MSMIAKFVTLKTSAEQFAAFKDALTALAIETRKESGNLGYDVFDDGEQTCRIVEVWRDQSALDAHVEEQHTKDGIATFAPMLIDTPSLDDFYPTAVAAASG